MRRFTGDRLVIATHNAGKLQEMRLLLGPHGITAVGAAELGLAVPAETETPFVGNARLKARAARPPPQQRRRGCRRWLTTAG